MEQVFVRVGTSGKFKKLTVSNEPIKDMETAIKIVRAMTFKNYVFLKQIENGSIEQWDNI